MKIQLLLPAGEIHRNGTGIFETALRYAPLTPATLAGLVPEELNAEITIQDEGSSRWASTSRPTWSPSAPSAARRCAPAALL